MRKSLIFFTLLAAVIIRSGGLSRAERRRGRAPEDERQEHLNVGGVDRTYFLRIPRSLAEGASAPLVLVFHGGGHAANMPHFTHFDELADREGFWWRIRRVSTRAGTTRAAFLQRMASVSFAC